MRKKGIDREIESDRESEREREREKIGRKNTVEAERRVDDNGEKVEKVSTYLIFGNSFH